MRKFFIAAAVAVISLIASGSTAQAAFQFQLQASTDGGATWTSLGTSTSNPDTISGTVAGLNITATQNGFLSTLKSTLDLSISGILTQTSYNLVIQATVTDVPTSPAPQFLSWSFTSSSGLAGAGSTLVETAQGWVDQSNTAFGTTGGGIVATTGSLSAPASGGTSFSATPPYSWTSQYTLTGTTGDAVGNALSADFAQHITTPAPAGLVLALTGMPMLGLGAWVRRRRLATAA